MTRKWERVSGWVEKTTRGTLREKEKHPEEIKKNIWKGFSQYKRQSRTHRCPIFLLIIYCMPIFQLIPLWELPCCCKKTISCLSFCVNLTFSATQEVRRNCFCDKLLVLTDYMQKCYFLLHSVVMCRHKNVLSFKWSSL